MAELIELVDLESSFPFHFNSAAVDSLWLPLTSVPPSLLIEELAVVAEPLVGIPVAELGQTEIEGEEAACIVALDMVPDRRPTVLLRFLDDPGTNRIQVGTGKTVDLRGSDGFFRFLSGPSTFQSPISKALPVGIGRLPVTFSDPVLPGVRIL